MRLLTAEEGQWGAVFSSLTRGRSGATEMHRRTHHRNWRMRLLTANGRGSETWVEETPYGRRTARWLGRAWLFFIVASLLAPNGVHFFIAFCQGKIE